MAGHHVRGNAYPGRENGAGGAAAVIAMVGHDHREGELAVGEGVKRAFGLDGDHDLVADGATVAAAMKNKGMVWKRHFRWV